MNTIVHLIKQKKLDSIQREKINKILYISYEKMAIKQAISFKKIHYHKCKNIDKNDLIVSGKIGLFHSINKYNGNSSFINFVNFYIKIELLKTLTSHYSSSRVPKYIRMKKKTNFSKDELSMYKKNMGSYIIDYDWVNKMHCIEEPKMYKYEETWEKINDLDDVFVKRIIYLKYDIEFNKIRNNKRIAQLMCCSEECIRKGLKNIDINIL
jgi:DNA-directed RNA polymerase specialized sigma subunit